MRVFQCVHDGRGVGASLHRRVSSVQVRRVAAEEARHHVHHRARRLQHTLQHDTFL